MIDNPNALIRTRLENSLQASSLKSLVQRRQQEKTTFLLLDCSGSMAEPCRPGERRIDALRAVVDTLHAQVACPLVGFGLSLDSQTADVAFITRVPEPMGSTPLDKAITFGARHQATHLIVVSDGEPNSPERTLEAAKAFAHPIDVFYVGPPGGPGEAFLTRLAQASGGQRQTTSLRQPEQLVSGIKGLLGAGR